MRCNETRASNQKYEHANNTRSNLRNVGGTSLTAEVRRVALSLPLAGHRQRLGVASLCRVVA